MAASEQSARRRDLDRLRVAACLSTFFYHAVQVFDLNPYYHLKSLTASAALDVAARLLHAVRMPLFFLIAGMVSAMLLGRYSGRELIGQRARRLLPPFFLGILLLTPWIKVLEVKDGRSISFRGIRELSPPLPDTGVVLWRYFTSQAWFTWSHMWFLLYLFLLSVVLLPLLQALRRSRGEPPAPTLALAVVPLVVLIAIEMLLRPLYPWHLPNLIADWASLSVYVTVYLAGAALVHWPRLESDLQRGLPLSAALLAIGVWLYVGLAAGPWTAPARALVLWSFLAVVIGLGPLLQRGRIPGEPYLSEAALPLYVLHHVPLVVIASLVKDLEWPIWQRYVTIVGGAMIVTFVGYHLLVRPFDSVRWMMGMSPRRPERTTSPSPLTA